MGGDPDLGILGRAHDGCGEGREQVRMEAGFRFIQSQERAGARAEQGRNQAETYSSLTEGSSWKAESLGAGKPQLSS